MWELYKKVQKTIENPRGARKIEDNENPFIEPSMLCISAQNTRAKSVFGITKTAMRMGRIRVSGDDGAKINMSTVPVNFLSIKQSNGRHSEIEADKEFVQKYFKPLIESDGKKIDIKLAKKNLRNINIMGYCNGLERVNSYIELLRNEAIELGYTSEEIDELISQIAVISISTVIDINQNKATCFDVFDLNDEEHQGANPNNITVEAVQSTIDSDIKEHMHVNSPTKATYTFLGDGVHDLKKYLNNGKALPVIISRVTANCLENSIQNRNSKELVPLNMDVMLYGCDKIMENACNGIEPSVQMKELDNNIQYEGAKRYTDSELKLIQENEEILHMYMSTKEDLRSVSVRLDNTQDKMDNILETAKEICSERNYLELLSKSGWQLSRQQEDIVQNTQTDAQQIAEKNKLILRLQQMLDKTLGFCTKVRNSIFGRILYKQDIKALPNPNEEDFDFTEK